MDDKMRLQIMLGQIAQDSIAKGETTRQWESRVAKLRETLRELTIRYVMREGDPNGD